MTETCRDLQSQINMLNEERAKERAEAGMKALETLQDSNHFKYSLDGLKNEELKNCTYHENLKSKAWNEPRMFTLK